MRNIWLFLYTFAAFLHVLAYGLHFSFARYYVKLTLGYDYNFIILLSAAELLPLLFAVIAGVLADIIGRRKIIFVGFIGSIMYLLIAIYGLNVFIPSIAIAILSISIVNIATAGVVLDVGRISGRVYAIYTIGMTLGWGIAGILLSILPTDLRTVYTLIAILEGLMVTIYILFFPSESIEHASFKEIVNAISASGKDLLRFFIAVILATLAMELIWNGYSFKLIDIVHEDKLLFGIVYATLPSITGVIGRYIAGALVDKHSPVHVFLGTILMLIIVATGLHYTTGVLAILFWLIPTYALYDISSAISIGRFLGKKKQATAMGIVTLATAIGGLPLLTLPLILGKLTIETIYIIILVSLAISLLLPARKIQV